ncbi:hypothetical protein C8J55DRAFT_562669 [Lentinula edodes]|uniref:Uncharacterized protein n=1 Tax=Lentinula lateritia TaxID=40482 RepID=A0A9W9A445_9AGAR|nr:hypothetical protein C8J55DRAFT_562669 [Lentinula edodes]
MGSGITLFHKLLAACILLVGSLGVIASPVVISGDSLSARHLKARYTIKLPVSLCAGLVVDENQQMLLVFREKDSSEFKHAFTRNSEGTILYKEMDKALQQQVKPFVLNSVEDVPTFLIFIPDDQHFLTESAKGTQGTQWIKKAMVDLMIRHNSLRLNLKGRAKKPAAFILEGEGDAKKPIDSLIDSMGTRGKDSSKP